MRREFDLRFLIYDLQLRFVVFCLWFVVEFRFGLVSSGD
jgi:hypothetical protein